MQRHSAFAPDREFDLVRHDLARQQRRDLRPPGHRGGWCLPSSPTAPPPAGGKAQGVVKRHALRQRAGKAARLETHRPSRSCRTTGLGSVQRWRMWRDTARVAQPARPFPPSVMSGPRRTPCASNAPAASAALARSRHRDPGQRLRLGLVGGDVNRHSASIPPGNAAAGAGLRNRRSAARSGRSAGTGAPTSTPGCSSWGHGKEFITPSPRAIVAASVLHIGQGDPPRRRRG